MTSRREAIDELRRHRAKALQRDGPDPGLLYRPELQVTKGAEIAESDPNAEGG